MKKVLTLILCMLTSVAYPAVDDYVWTMPSIDSSESMPLGGGDIGMNVWVDAASGDIVCLLSESGCFDENNTLLKLGRLRIKLDGRREMLIEQRLRLQDGSMIIRFEETEITLWVDVWKPVVHIDANRPIQVIYESWRTKDTPVNRFICQESSWKWVVPKICYTRSDSILSFPDGTKTFWHQNISSPVLDYTLDQQGMVGYIDSIYNPIRHRIFGGKTVRHTVLSWSIVLCNQQSTLQEWKDQLRRTQNSIRAKEDRKATTKWWNDYWERSFIKTDGDAREAVRNYTLFRYMLGCNAHPAKEGERWPTKFNGGLFTFDPCDCDTVMEEYNTARPGIVTPDYRRWGGGTHTAQNQRLIYWPMLQTGDWDALQGQLDFYSRLLPAAELRSHHYWNHRGACYTEQLENFGFPNTAEYGKHKNGGDPGVEDNRWLEYLWDTSLEFADIYCLYPFEQSPHGKVEAAKAAKDLIISSLQFFDEHYTLKDDQGHKIFYPGSGCETYKKTRNASSTVAGLHRLIIDALKRQKDLHLSEEEIAWLKRFKAELPPIPTYTKNGKTLISPAETWDRIQNTETPQLYPVWPWRMVDIELARDTYLNDSVAIAHRNYIGWKQDNIWAAYAGLTKEAWDLMLKKLVVKKPTPVCNIYRFPAFWGPGFDWMPDHNRGGSAMIGLHAMLMQEDDEGNIKLLPAWPKNQNVHFRLWTNDHRQVEVEYRDGQFVKYLIDGKKANP